ncbi:type IV pilus assembly PilZ [Anaeromyxobacter sp. K]|uniref:PilZ domain-containing protein n=1 Tax=Anaeromyxobacter sp. (strain K) TaxID=447217 RepID=UPI00015F9EFA|nr:PilZ domain-containing protein [Anaeromyxobacter sp. K]ACG73605.1 type IV pilus assembly PilZ [Anaeromyxobacter sp. K]
MSSLSDWLKDFRALHAKARAGTLAGREADVYRAGRDELARALLAAQRLTLKPGELPRQALRVARALQVDLDMLTSAARALTVDVSSGGFACLLAKAPPAGDEVKVSMRLPGGEALACRARVTDVKPLQGNVRASFQLVGLTAAERERLELMVFDTVLEQLTA